MNPTPDEAEAPPRPLPDVPVEAAVNLFEEALHHAAAEPWKPGDALGGLVLLEKIADGGFGSVWRAMSADESGREVAVKIVKAGMDTFEVVRRFEQERAALARMEHSCIARVLDAGTTPEGRPFFVMELVRDGVALTEYCEEKKLPLEERLRLFIRVCEGVQHAHERGIIHRDLKPSNILVTEESGAPEPRIIDFGIAKAVTDDPLADYTLRTRAEQMIGTPLYMSPEQAACRADIDARTDVYALGVILYELAAGRPPFDAKALVSAGHEEMRRVICEEEPEAPSGSRSLDLVCLRALEKDRARRHASAAALGEDVRCVLEGRPLDARTRSTACVMHRWCRRHRVVLRRVVGAVLTVVLLGGVAFMAWRLRDAEVAAASSGSLRIAENSGWRVKKAWKVEHAPDSAHHLLGTEDVLYIAGGKEVRRLDTRTGERQVVIAFEGVHLAPSPDGRWLVWNTLPGKGAIGRAEMKPVFRLLPPLKLSAPEQDDDPKGIAFIPEGWHGDPELSAGDVLVVDAGFKGPDGLWRLRCDSDATPEQLVGSFDRNFDLTDITATQRAVFVSNRVSLRMQTEPPLPEDSTHRVLRFEKGTLISCRTDHPLFDPSAIIADPTNGDLYVVEGKQFKNRPALQRLLRLRPSPAEVDSYSVQVIATHFVTVSDAGLDLSADGRCLLVTDTGADTIYELRRE